jgi:hypothetical protein
MSNFGQLTLKPVFITSKEPLARPLSNQDSSFPDTGRIYIKGYLYPILYPKISKKDISYPFLEQDILRI